MADRIDVDEMDPARLEAAFSALREAAEPPGLHSAGTVRRRGNHRRRTQRAGVVVVVAALAVAAVGVAEAVGQLPDRGAPAPPATGVDDEPRLALDPFLPTAAVPAVGPYTDYTVTGPVDRGEAFSVSCGGPASPAGWAEVDQLARQAYGTDLDATFVETVAVFRDEEAAAAALADLDRPCRTADPESLGPGLTTRYGQLAGLDGARTGQLATPTGDGDLGYHEIAYARSGPLVVVLDWSSMGSPHGEEPATFESWRWVWSEEQVAAALARALGERAQSRD